MNPKIIAIIPARGGSKRLPGKNTKDLLGKPLIAYSIEHALTSKLISEVIVSTEDENIAKVSKEAGAKVFTRPKSLASDQASSESALINVLDMRNEQGKEDPDIVVFLQCTSPVRKPGEIDLAIEKLQQEKANSLLSVCQNKNFLWSPTPNGAKSLNYDFKSRPREQDFEPQFRENGSMYIFQSKLLRETGNRLGGRIALFEMDYLASFQIDEPEDFDLVKWVLQQQPTQLKKAS